MRKIKERGITLIALVVTIVVLLILAGISISMLTGKNGVITQAKKSKEETIIGDEKEGISLAYSSCKADNMMENVTSSQLEERMKLDGKDVTVTQEGINLKVKYPKTGHEYIVNQNGKIENNTPSNPEEIINGMYSKYGVILEKKSGEVLYVKFDTEGDSGEINTKDATVITTDGIAQTNAQTNGNFYSNWFIDKKGKAYTWGSNGSGELGDGTKEKRSTPICISEIEGSALKGKKIVSVEGKYSMYAIDTEGKIYTWGYNKYGQLGDGTKEDRSTPICISEIEGSALKGKKIVSVEGTFSMYAIDTEGKIYTWGYNEYGQLGDGTKENRSTPICISEIEGSALKGKKIVSVEGDSSMYAIDTEGKIYTWGYNEYGQLGDGTKENRYIPICISEIEGSALKGKKIVSLEGYYSKYAIDTEGKIYTWGYNRYGQLGDGTKENRSTPICISEIEGSALKGKKIVSIKGYYNNSVYAIDIEEKLYTWGNNHRGELGDGTKEDRSTPICINNSEKNKIVKVVNSFENEEGFIFIKDKGESYCIYVDKGPE